MREIKSPDPKHYRLGPTLSSLAGCARIGGLSASCSGGLQPRRSAASLKLVRFFAQNPLKSTDFHHILLNIEGGKVGIHQFQVKISAYAHLWSKPMCHQNWYVIKPQMSLKLNVTKTEISQPKMSQKLKYHLNSNVTKTEMSTKIECHYN